MAFEVKFELSETDLDHFRDVMRKAQQGAKTLSEATILDNAKKLALISKIMCLNLFVFAFKN